MAQVFRPSEAKCAVCGRPFREGEALVYIVKDDKLEPVHLLCALRPRRLLSFIRGLLAG